MYKLIILGAILVNQLVSCQTRRPKEIALSFDDAPRRLTGHFTGYERAEELVKAMKSVGVDDAVFYCNSSFITPDNEKILKLYSKEGYTIANHTHTHPSFSKENFVTYKKDFLTAHKILSKYPTFKRYFRFPYLREGNEVKKRDQMKKLLEEMEYINGYITVDFSDWHLEHLFRQSLAKKEKVDLEKLKELYISLAFESLDHYDKLAMKYLKRSPKHVLLLHETDLAALFIDDLVRAMKKKNWKVISSEEAYKDDLVNYRFKKAMGYNPGRVGEVAMENGHPVKEIWAHSTYTKNITKRYKTEVLGLKL